MAKKKKSGKVTVSKDTGDFIFPVLLLSVLLLCAIYLYNQLQGQQFMAFAKTARIFWIFLLILFAGLAGIRLFRPIENIKQNYYLYGLLALTGTGFLLLMNGSLYFSGDSGLYLVLAKSLAGFKGFMNVHLPEPNAHRLYGFGLPLLISPVIFFFGMNITMANLVIVLSSVGFIFFLFRILNKYIELEFALLICMIVAFNFWISMFAAVVMTELPFCMFMLMGFYYIDKYAEKDTPVLGRYLYIGAGIAIYCYAIKPVGIGIAAAAFVYLILIKRDWKKALLISGIFLVGFILWNVRNYISAGSLGYLDMIRTSLTSEGVSQGREFTRGFGLIGNLFTKQLKILGQGHEIFIGSIFQNSFLINKAVSIILVIIMYGGFIVHLVKKRSILDFTIAIIFYGTVVFAFIPNPSRYYLPLIPFMYYYLFFGIQFILSQSFNLIKIKDSKRIVNLILVSLLLFTLSMNIVSVNKVIASQHPGREYTRQDLQDYFEMAKWIKTNLPEDAIVASRLDKEMFVLTDRKSVNARIYKSYDTQWNEEKGAEIIKGLKELIIKHRIDFFVLDATRSDSYMTKMTLFKNQDVLREIFNVVFGLESTSSYVLQVKSEWKEANFPKQ